MTYSGGTSYTKHRVLIDNLGGSEQINFGEIEFYESNDPADMTLISESVTAKTADPGEAFILLWEEDMEALTLNTHLEAWASRDSGTTFTTDYATNDKLSATSHGLSNNDRVTVSSSGTLPAGLDAATVYYVVNATTNDFEVSTSQGGGAVELTGDGGGTHTFTVWTNATLSEKATLSTGRVLTGTADISGQPSGTTMRWMVTAHGGKELRLYGVGMEWS